MINKCYAKRNKECQGGRGATGLNTAAREGFPGMTCEPGEGASSKDVWRKVILAEGRTASRALRQECV